MNTVAWGLVGALFLAGCSGGDPVDIGNDEVTGEKLEDYAASWDGYAEAFEFLDGSDRLRLFLNESGQGTLVAGDSPSSVLSDPDRWPFPDLNLTDARPREGFGIPLPGFAYVALDTRVEGNRIRFEFNPLQAESDWCELQTPIADETNEGEYGCLPNWATRYGDACSQENPTTGVSEPVDCGKVDLCQGFCRCDAGGCEGRDLDLGGAFDAVLAENGKALIGTMAAGDVSLTVRLGRAH